MITFELNEEQYDLLCKLYPNDEMMARVANGKNKNTYSLDDDDYCDFVLFVDDAIIEKGMVNQDYLTNTGVKLQEIYDSLISQSKKRNQMK